MQTRYRQTGHGEETGQERQEETPWENDTERDVERDRTRKKYSRRDRNGENSSDGDKGMRQEI